jgi:F-type H+-transporting ATPase subunit delta
LSSQSVSRRYAIALADVLSEGTEPESVKQELQIWERMIASSPDLREVIANPTIPYEQKKGVLNELIGRTDVRQTTANFLQVLLRNQRLLALPEINAKLADVLDERAGAVAAHVTTAAPIDEPTRKLLA